MISGKLKVTMEKVKLWTVKRNEWSKVVRLSSSWINLGQSEVLQIICLLISILGSSDSFSGHYLMPRLNILEIINFLSE